MKATTKIWHEKWEKYDKYAKKMNTVLGTIQSVQNIGLQLILE